MGFVYVASLLVYVNITTILANFYNLADFLQSSPDTESQMIADTINIHVESIYLTVYHTDETRSRT